MELVHSVVALDPGMAYAILQLANDTSADGSNQIWHLPLAIVTAGRKALQQILHQAPRVEFWPDRCLQAQAHQLVADAVVRASLAYILAQELHGCEGRSGFLAGLLLDIRKFANLALADQSSTSAKLLSSMCRCLPSSVVRIALAPRASSQKSYEVLAEIVLLADVLVQQYSAPGRAPVVTQLNDSVPRHPWRALSPLERQRLGRLCSVVFHWSTASLQRINPWEFIVRLESREFGM